MEFFTEITRQVDDLRTLLGARLTTGELGPAVSGLDDDGVVAVIAQTTAIVRSVENLRIVASGVAGARSTREHGHDGLTQKRGHRNAVTFVQEITGASRAEAAKTIRLGESMLETASAEGADTGGADAGGAGTGGADAERPVPALPWHAPLSAAQLAGTLSATQHDVIRRGLGEPPTVDPATMPCICDPARSESGDGTVATIPALLSGDDPVMSDPGIDTDGTVPGHAARGAAPARTICPVCAAAANASAVEAWSTAAEQLIVEAQHRTVEELGSAARTLRDLLDPEGAERRFTEQFERRSFRVWTDRDGARRGSIIFDPHAGSWILSLINAAMRPRRGGPRFVDPEEKAQAEDLVEDPRSNDQLVYDLIIDTLRAGSLADAKAVFGTRQAGVRVLTTVDAIENVKAGIPATALVEDDLSTLPGWLVLQQACDTGALPFTIDRDGNPLFLGREARLFSPKQKITLAARDGGCRWPRCDRPASMCESHHIDHCSEGGSTDVDRGILLCRWHHMALHNGGWRITRDGLGDFLLHPPPGRGDPIVLEPRLALQYAWADLDPPPRRFRPVRPLVVERPLVAEPHPGR